MKRFLVDENLPRTLQLEEEDHFVFVVDFRRQMSDTEIWEYAIQNDYIIITKDTDFYDRMVINGPPPKVIWIRIGNTRRRRLEEIIKRSWNKVIPAIEKFDLIEVYEDKIEGIKT
jgi:predicted nuclease of predicted toxin-antitoxin system